MSRLSDAVGALVAGGDQLPGFPEGDAEPRQQRPGRVSTRSTLDLEVPKLPVQTNRSIPMRGLRAR
jgi:hypothetical protein